MFEKGTVGTNELTVNSEVFYKERNGEERSDVGQSARHWSSVRQLGEHVLLRSIKRFQHNMALVVRIAQDLRCFDVR